MPNRPRLILPLLGGTFTIAIVQTRAPVQTGPGPARSPRQRVVARLQRKAKLVDAKPSDEVEGLKFVVKWEPAKGALGIYISQEDATLPAEVLQVVCLYSTAHYRCVLLISCVFAGCR